MKVKVTLDSSGRRGKKVSVVTGITHNPQVIETLTMNLKKACGAGGTIKGKTIEIQGDHVAKIKKYLEKDGYSVA